MPDESARRRESARVLRTALRRLRWERLKFRLRLIGPLRYYEFFESLGTVEARSDESYLLVMASHPGNGRPPLLLTPGYHCRFGQFVRGTGEVRYAEITLTVDDAGRPRLRSVGRTHPGDRAGWRAMVRDIRALWSTRGSGAAHEEDTFEAAVRRYHARWPSPRRGSGASARSGFSEPGEGNAHGGQPTAQPVPRGRAPSAPRPRPLPPRSAPRRSPPPRCGVRSGPPTGTGTFAPWCATGPGRRRWPEPGAGPAGSPTWCGSRTGGRPDRSRCAVCGACSSGLRPGPRSPTWSRTCPVRRAADRSPGRRTPRRRRAR